MLLKEKLGSSVLIAYLKDPKNDVNLFATKKKRRNNKSLSLEFNPFLANDPILYLLKTPENLKTFGFLFFSGGFKSRKLIRKG